MNKLDFKKKYKQFYSASKVVEIVNVPEFSYLMVDGKGNPNTSPLFPSALEILYSLSYTMKFSIKGKNEDNDYVVPPLQGLWWMGNNDYFDANNKDEWKWTVMIAQPAFVNQKILDAAKEAVMKKKGIDGKDARLENYIEGTSVQILHIGPYSEETENISKLHRFMEENGYKFNGKHHEIYLSDPRKTVHEKLKTIIRQPVMKINPK